MGIFSRQKHTDPPQAAAYSAGSAVAPHGIQQISPQQVAELIHNKTVGKTYIRPDIWTDDSRYKWAEEVYVGKVARNIITLAKNRMASRLVGGDEDTQELCDRMSSKTHLQTTLQRASIHWDKYGHVYIYPVYAEKSRKTLLKLKLLHPPTLKVYRNSAKEITDLNEKLRQANLPKVVDKPGSGDEIVGYIQTIDDQVWFFEPREIIFIPRYPDGDQPNGRSLLVQAADIISGKLQIEHDQVVMAGRHGDPKHIFYIPPEWYDESNVQKLNQFKDDMNRGIRAGMDFYMSKSDNPQESVDVKLLEATGNPQAVIKTQDHAENQFVATFGLADSFTESESSNRSVGEIQLAFFERDLMADRIMFAEILEDEIIDPWLIANDKQPRTAWFEFADLTPDDRLKKLQILAPIFPYLEQSIVNQVLEQAGYKVDADDRPTDIPTAATGMAKRYGDHTKYRRLPGVPKKEAALVRSGRDGITTNLDRYRQIVREVFADEAD